MNRFDSLDYIEAQMPGFANRLMEMYMSCIENIRQRRELDGQQDRLLQRQRRIQMLRSLRRSQINLRNQRRRCARPHEGPPQPLRKYWEDIIPNISDERFQKKFRVCPETFDLLVNKLQPTLQNSTINIAMRKKIALSLYMLKSSANVDDISDKFEIGRKLAWKILEEFCDALNSVFYPEVVEFPKSFYEAEQEATKFKNMSGFPDCIGVVDCLHVPIKKVTDNEDCLNIKGYYSLVLIAIVNSESKFTFMNFSNAGKLSNAQVLTNSMLEDNMVGLSQSFHLAGSDAFPLTNYVMTPFDPDPDERSFRNKVYNINHSKALSVSQTAYQRLLGRWGVLIRKPKLTMALWKKIVKSCVTLHNLCEGRNEVYFPQWRDRVEQFNNRYPQPSQRYHFMRQLVTATIKRNEIAEQLWNDFVEQ